MTVTNRRVDQTERALEALDAVTKAVHRRAEMLNAADDLETLTIIVRFNRKTGRPHRVIIRTEDQDNNV